MLAFITFALTVPAVFSGAAAIVFGALVDGRIGRGDHVGATQMSRWARILSWVTLGLLVIGGGGGALILVIISSRSPPRTPAFREARPPSARPEP